MKVDEVSKQISVKRMHLLLSVQAPLELAIGQRFQKGMHKSGGIHNFNAENWRYEWGLELSASGVRPFNSLELSEVLAQIKVS